MKRERERPSPKRRDELVPSRITHQCPHIEGMRPSSTDLLTPLVPFHSKQHSSMEEGGDLLRAAPNALQARV